MSQASLFDPPSRIPGPPRVRETEVQKGRRIVAEVAALPDRRWYLERVRARMRQLYDQRVQAYGVDYPRAWACVRPDDARAYFETLNPPAGMSRNFLAAVWREAGWEVVGSYKSETPGSHGNELKAYRWIE